MENRKIESIESIEVNKQEQCVNVKLAGKEPALKISNLIKAKSGNKEVWVFVPE